MATRVAINGFGRIGRVFFRIAFGHPEIEIVAVNDRVDAATLAHLLKYDSAYGIFPHPVEAQADTLRVNGTAIRAVREPDPARLPWKELEVDYVVEASGVFTDRPSVEKHLAAGARRVIVSAPAKNPDLSLVMGVNADRYDPALHRTISNASCTTNCLAPIAKLLLDRFGIDHGFMTTVHSYTGDQPLLDTPHKDLRRARSAGVSMVPTTTGAARALSEVIPELAGKLDGMAVRVPTPSVSMIDFVLTLQRDATVSEVNALFRDAAAGPLAGIVEYTEAPLVSIDLKGNPHSAIIDGALTRMMGSRLLKVIAWYDNEWGYSSRLRDLILHLHKHEHPAGQS